MIDSTNKGKDYPKSSDGQTQNFPTPSPSIGAENANGGKLQQRESDVRYIVDNQIANSRGRKRAGELVRK